MTALLTVHLRVNDARTGQDRNPDPRKAGQPTPVRLHISTSTGNYFAPFGRQVDFATGRNEDVGGNLYLNRKKFAYIPGSCEIQLPTEVPLTIEITKGPRYLPIRQTVTLGKGQLALRFTIHPSTDPAWEGWESADSRTHFLSPHAAQLEAEAEGVDWVNLLATVQHSPSVDGHLYATIPNILAFSGQETVLKSVVVNTFNTHPTLGRLALLNCHRPVYPLTFGGDDSDDWSLGDWCNQCHRKKGLVVWSDAFRADTGLVGGEGLIGLILGEIDAIEIDARDRAVPILPWWYRLLNAGFRVPIVGGSGKDSNRIALGSMRTYTPTSTNYGEWIEQVRMRRTVVSNGPLIHFEVNRSLGHASARAVSLVPFEHLEIVVNGEVVAQKGMDSSMRSEIVYDLPALQEGWIAARCHGVAKSELYPLQNVFAHTSAIDLSDPAHFRISKRSALAALRRSVEETQRWIENEGRFQNPKSKQHLLERCERALTELTKRESESQLGTEEG